MHKNTYESVQVFGLDFFSSDKLELLKILTNELKNRKPTIVFTPNPEQIVQASSNNSFYHNLQEADVLIPDGIGIVWASRILKTFKKISQEIPERIAGREVVVELLKIAEKEGLKVLVVGGRNYMDPGSRMKDEGYPASCILHLGSNIKMIEGYDDIKYPTSQEELEIIKVIKDYKPDVVFVAFGAPNQEKWVIEHKKILEDSGVFLTMVVGGTFDQLLGKIPQVPKWLEKLNLEWLFRLIIQPWRIGRQTRLFKFVILTLKELIRN